MATDGEATGPRHGAADCGSAAGGGATAGGDPYGCNFVPLSKLVLKPLAPGGPDGDALADEGVATKLPGVGDVSGWGSWLAAGDRRAASSATAGAPVNASAAVTPQQPHPNANAAANAAPARAAPPSSGPALAPAPPQRMPVEAGWRGPRGPRRPPVELTAEQRQAVRWAVEGRSFFLTGSAGTGKTLALRHVVGALQERHGTAAVHVVASTGVAACHIGGTTLHHWAGVGLGEGSAAELTRTALGSEEAVARWTAARVIVIDEISMVPGTLFDALNAVACAVRRHPQKPFGGLQVIACGDFLQLPPVARGGGAGDFAFAARCWPAVMAGGVLELREVFRQRDAEFARVLAAIRLGQVTPAAEAALCRRLERNGAALPTGAGVEPTALFPYRHEVAALNAERVGRLPGDAVRYVAVDGGKRSAAKVLESCMASQELVLKPGAQVLLLKTLDMARGLVNGARGVVEDFVPSPSSTLFPRYPRVRFLCGATEVITEKRWTVEVGGVVQATRTQLPLGLAWALSIHKSQGLTLDAVVLSIANVFDHGHAYVALSRAVGLDRLLLTSWSRLAVSAHPQALQFYAEVSRRCSPPPAVLPLPCGAEGPRCPSPAEADVVSVSSDASSSGDDSESDRSSDASVDSGLAEEHDIEEAPPPGADWADSDLQLALRLSAAEAPGADPEADLQLAMWLSLQTTPPGPASTPLVHEGTSAASSVPDRQTLHAVLHRVFKHPDFRPNQLEALRDILSGRDVVFVAATGSGKSLLYQLPPLVSHRVALVASPLLALMQDQILGCRRKGLRAEAYSSSQSVAERHRVAGALLETPPGLDVLYCCPEQLDSPAFQQLLRRAAPNLGLFAVDEAHCIAKWGTTFRTTYSRLASIRKLAPGVPIVALTATATPKICADIQQSLAMRSAQLYTASHDRPNIHYSVRLKELLPDAKQDLLALLRTSLAGQSGIVYTFTRAETAELAAFLAQGGVKAKPYHAGLSSSVRDATLRQWLAGAVPVVVATVAFGMGIDKPDVRFVIHFTVANSVEGFFQEAGRAGRDGRPSVHVTYFSRVDVKRLRSLIQWDSPKGSAERETQLASLDALAGYCIAGLAEGRGGPQCRRRMLLQYFGEAAPAGPGPGRRCCDVCDAPAAVRAAFAALCAAPQPKLPRPAGGKKRRRKGRRKGGRQPRAPRAKRTPRALRSKEARFAARFLGKRARAPAGGRATKRRRG